MKKAKITISILLITVMLLGMIPTLISSAASNTRQKSTEAPPLLLWYDEEAPYGQENTSYGASQTPQDENDGWERWSLPIGNGYFGANIFGRTASERIQLSEKTLCNPYSATNNRGGLNNFSETYLDFGHTFPDTESYKRSLDINNAIAAVEYTYGGVKYEREYFTSYRDYCMVIKLTADRDGALAFTLRPTIPYIQDYVRDGGKENGTLTERITKHGNVTASTEGGKNVITLKGNMGYYNIDFIAEYQVFTNGTVSTGEWTHTYDTFVGYDSATETGENTLGLPVINDAYSSGVRDMEAQTITVTNGTLEISDASEAYIVITLGTNYDQSGGADNANIIGGTFHEGNKGASCAQDAEAENALRMEAALAKSFLNEDTTLSEAYEILKTNHINDYRELFGRVSFVLDYDTNDLALTTDSLLEKYKSGEGDGHYLEMLYYQYGRYLLIASSRENTLPANLQGVWNRYNFTPWSGGYWHNINVQMNYWHAFSSNLAECFKAYVNYEQSYLEKAKTNAKKALNNTFNANISDAEKAGISIGIGGTPYRLDDSASCGELGFTTQMFWDYYEYTQDREILETIVYPLLYEAAEFITQTVAYYEDEDAYLSVYSYSAEQKVGSSFYYTVGTTYSQSFAYLNNKHLVEAAKILNKEDDELLSEVKRQLNKYDAILVGYSGQIKEFREEDYYGDIGEWEHRHISQLVGLFPGEMINATTPAWLDAATVTLTERGDQSRGWSAAHKLALWARTKNGERAHDLYESLLKNFTATNLWNLHFPYQIDGNFGGSAGVTEMLLQSHEGYVEPLAAIPSSWKNGSYTGLAARGGFTVDASWADGSITALTVHSPLGGDLTLKAQNIASAAVTDLDGNPVSFTSAGKDYITFSTLAGKSYIISDIPEKVTVSPAKDLTVTQSVRNAFDIEWQPSADAESYNIYKAAEDAPKYTLIANASTTNYRYTVSDTEENKRMTYRVCAVNENGRESSAVLAYVNPEVLLDVTSVEAAELDSGALQVMISTSGEATSYELYEYVDSQSSWKSVATSKYPVLIYDGYDPDKSYAASASYRFTSSELVEITDVGFVGGSNEFVENTNSNVFLNATVEFTSGGRAPGGTVEYATVKTTAAGYTEPEKAVDGDQSTRFGPNSTWNSIYSLTFTLPSSCNLKTMKLYTFHACNEVESTSEKTFIEIYADGEWTVHLGGDDGFRLVNTKIKDSLYESSFDLGFVRAEKVRITFVNTSTEGSTAVVEKTTPKNVTSIYEITSTAAKIPTVDRSALLEKITVIEANLSQYNAVAQLLLENELEKAKEILTSATASTEALNAAINALDSIIADADDYAPKIGKYNVDDDGNTWAFNKSTGITKVSGILGNSSQVYKLAASGTLYGNANYNACTVGNDLCVEFDILVTEGALIDYSFQAMTGTGSKAWIMRFYFGDGVIKTNDKAKSVTGSGASISSNVATLCNLENDRWYKIAIVMPGGASASEAASTVFVYVNGEKYEITTNSSFYNVVQSRYIMGNANPVYLDNVTYTDSLVTIYNHKYDAPIVPADVHGELSFDGNDLIAHSGSYTAGELSELLSLKLAVMRNGALIGDTDTVALGDTVIIPPQNNKNSYAYYKVKNHVLDFIPGEDGYCGKYACDGCDSFRLDFTPKVSITLDSDLILNVYIPDVRGVSSVVINGESYDLSQADICESYRRIRIPLASSEAFKELGTAISISHSSGKVVGRYTFSLVKYAEKILGGESGETEKKLMKDILAYVSSAYAYFGNKIPDRVTSLLSGHITVFEPAEAANSTKGLKSATFVLDDTPAVRFYLDGTVEAGSFTFRQNGKILSYTTGSNEKGNFIEIRLYAYAMIDTFTYTISGSDEIYEFNLASYCEYLKNDYAEADRDKLLDLGQKFYVYCASAAQYRAEITSEMGDN